mmetsp:Transcript_29126/g.59602  ORF Transcript_29126/g.59602 Transcript_29126/m.59602 type:complete len:362 (+) Transcript_29126:30-1115(+)
MALKFLSNPLRVLPKLRISPRLFSSPSSLADSCSVNVIFEDEYFFFLHKPAGLLVAGQRPGDGVVSFHDMVKEYSLKHYNYWPTLLHRLDKETSGIMVYPKSKHAAKHFLGLQEKQGAITKEYLAVVRGSLPDEKGVISGGIMRSRDNLTFTVVKNSKAGKHVKTAYWRLGTTQSEDHPTRKGETFTGVRLALGTGRQHQVRASLRTLGCSIIGDTRYGGPKWKTSPKLQQQEDPPTPNSNERDDAGHAKNPDKQRMIMLHAQRVAFKGCPPEALDLNPAPPRRSNWKTPKASKSPKATSLNVPKTVVAPVPVVDYNVVCNPPACWGNFADLVKVERSQAPETSASAVGGKDGFGEAEVTS